MFCRFAGFKEAERERLAKHFDSNFKLDMLDKELAVKVNKEHLFLSKALLLILIWFSVPLTLKQYV